MIVSAFQDGKTTPPVSLGSFLHHFPHLTAVFRGQKTAPVFKVIVETGGYAYNIHLSARKEGLDLPEIVISVFDAMGFRMST